MGFRSSFKRRFRKGKAPIRRSSQATSTTASSSVPVQPALGTAGSPSLVTISPPPAKSESVPLHTLQKKIWDNAYQGLKSEEPKLVEAFESIILSEPQLDDDSAEPTDRTEGKATAKPTVTPHQMRKFVERGIERTKKEASVKQELDRGWQAVQAVMGIVDTAIRAAPEAAVIWATVCLGIEVLKNPITEALENRQGIHLLLDKNKKSTAATVLRDALEESITQLFQQLLSYQIRSICLYRRNKVVGFIRDMFLIDNWAGQVISIKEAEKAVQHDIEQYNTQESQQQMQKLNDSTAAMQANVANIHTAVQSLAEQQAKAREDDKNNECLRELYVTDPRIDKEIIENRKGGLLKDSYKWILEHQGFKKFKNEAESRILWIKGDPGKGKTMLLCGIINELESDHSTSPYYFFCQDTGGSRLNTATSVLRGLVYHLTKLNPQLIEHVRKGYDPTAKNQFENEGAWYHISKIATAMLEDPSMKNAILIVDALDECAVGQGLLLDFIKTSSAKWIVSSRNRPEIEQSLNDATQRVKIHLEINEDSVSMAVNFFIKYKVNQLVQKKGYGDEVKDAVLEYLQSNSHGTFLWVALVCQELFSSKTRRWETLAKLKSFPPGLDALYGQMLKEISESPHAQLYKEVIAKVLVVYRPITLEELRAMVEALKDFNIKDIEEVVASCASFFTLHNNAVSFVHQSAKDYFLGEALGQVLPSGISHQHQVVLVRSLELLQQTLKRDIYNLQAPGCLISEISAAPDPDPLAGIQYSCIFWVDHLHDSSANVIASENDKILAFFKEKYLQWLEALSLMGNIYTGVRAIRKLETCLKKASTDLHDIVKDASRFLLSNPGGIEIAPLQVYASALVFSPTNSIIRRTFAHEEPDWIKLKPRAVADWDACLQTLEGHVASVSSVVFSYDGQRLASGSDDKTVKIWDATSGACLQTLEGHVASVSSVVFSYDGQRLASGSWDSTVKIWDATSGACLQTLEGHGNCVTSVVFSNDGQRLASGSCDSTVKIWDATSGACLQTLEGHGRSVASVVFSNDGQRLASGSYDSTVKIWNAASGACLQTLEGHGHYVTSVVFSNDGQRLSSGSYDSTVKIWDATSGACLQTLEGHGRSVASVVFSNDGQRLASGSYDSTVKIWDATSGACLQTLEGHGHYVTSVVFSNDGQRLSSGSYDSTVKIWDATSGACLQILEGHDNWVTSVVFSNDGQRLASGSDDSTVKIWDATSGVCLQTLEGHDNWVTSVVFSNDGQRLASGSDDSTVKIWDAASGVCLQTFEGHGHYVTSVVFSNDGQRLSSGSYDSTVKIWDATSGACLQTLEGHDRTVSSIVFSNDGQRLASGSWDSTVKIWDATSGVCLQTLEGHGRSVASVVFSNDGQRLASGSWDNTVKIWDANSGACLQTLEGHGRSVASVVFSNDGQRLASRSDDSTAKIWDATSGACLETLTDHGSSMTPKIFSNDGAMIASGLPASKSSSLRSKSCTYSINGDGSWIMENGQRLLWMPPSFRAAASTVCHAKLGLGTGSGRVIIIGF
ncbi:Vegetative incompatibility protein HET-E-1 [Ceratocystis lukuohia]|uniref:Vegetative incompatibility protein HET-E-1 n=1 Tax=Ceratocystis lukuohia TaxID=2019550 RepID=A0ABR4MLF2_9PEZI